MSELFLNNSTFGHLTLDNITTWNVSNVTNMSSMFKGASIFNQNISSWDVSNVTNMTSMFEDAVLFDKFILTWTLNNNVTLNMFKGARAFKIIIIQYVMVMI